MCHETVEFLKPSDELERLYYWVFSDRKKPTALAFSSGLARRIADEIESLESELQRQLNEAWMRLDYATADRIAKLIGVDSPITHEVRGA